MARAQGPPWDPRSPLPPPPGLGIGAPWGPRTPWMEGRKRPMGRACQAKSSTQEAGSLCSAFGFEVAQILLISCFLRRCVLQVAFPISLSLKSLRFRLSLPHHFKHVFHNSRHSWSRSMHTSTLLSNPSIGLSKLFGQNLGKQSKIAKAEQFRKKCCSNLIPSTSTGKMKILVQNDPNAIPE